MFDTSTKNSRIEIKPIFSFHFHTLFLLRLQFIFDYIFGSPLFYVGAFSMHESKEICNYVFVGWFALIVIKANEIIFNKH